MVTQRVGPSFFFSLPLFGSLALLFLRGFVGAQLSGLCSELVHGLVAKRHSGRRHPRLQQNSPATSRAEGKKRDPVKDICHYCKQEK